MRYRNDADFGNIGSDISMLGYDSWFVTPAESHIINQSPYRISTGVAKRVLVETPFAVRC